MAAEMGEAGPGNRRILVVDADPRMGQAIGAALATAGYEPTCIPRLPPPGSPALERIEPAAVLLHLDPLAEPAAPIRAVRAAGLLAPILVLADPGRLQAAVGALRHGAEDYLLRPPDAFELAARLGRVLERRDLDSRLSLLADELSKRHGTRAPVTASASMAAVLDRIRRVAPMRATVLIYGESGVGKELVARAIHFDSPRRDQPFVALNCAAMPAQLIESELFGHEKGAFTGATARTRGKFELAHHGTLFLDEIGEMDPTTQAKLLRVLEEREFMRVGGDRSLRVDVRVIAATNADLDAMVARGRFRQDLYYRLKVVTIHVPPLRERRADIPELVETFLDELSRNNAVRRKAVTPEAMTALAAYSWPGNVRELKNVLESLLVSTPGETIRLEDLPQTIARRSPRTAAADAAAPGTTLAQMERELIRRTLEHTGGNRTHSAQLLGIGVRTLQRKITEYGLDIPPTRRRPRTRRALAH
jgi:DNA-binding NtrC family response regulator